MGLYSRDSRVNWFNVYYVVVVHIGALLGLHAALLHAKWSTLCCAIVFAYLSGLGITAGAHRLWAHNSYKAHGSVRFFFMLCNSIANQGSIFQWVRDHRVHHKFVDTPADPHDSTRGFFYAHIGWMMYRKDPRVIEAGKKLNYDDLWADWTVRLQYQLCPWGNLFMGFLFPPLVTIALNSETWWNAIFVSGFLRYGVVLHITALVNSAAHVYGYWPRDAKQAPLENWLLAAFAIGEGWHNWHHKYPYDYAASELGLPKRFNPTRLLIDLFAWLGLVTDRRRITPIQDKLLKKRMRASKTPQGEQLEHDVDEDATDSSESDL